MMYYLAYTLFGFVFLCASIVTISYFKVSNPLASILFTVLTPLIAVWHFNLGFALIVLGFNLQTSLGYDSHKLSFEQPAFNRKYGHICDMLGHILILLGVAVLIWSLFFK